MGELKRVTFEQLINGEVNQVSILNEPVDFFVDFAVKAETALSMARRRWFGRKNHERE